MSVKAIAIDDEPLAVDIIKTFCNQLQDVELLDCFDNAPEALEYIHKNNPHLLFLDINMPDMTGLELVNKLHTKPMIIFTTAYKEFALQGFELDAVDYLLKPFSFERFEKAVQKAMKNIGSSNDDFNLYVFADYRMLKIAGTDIMYIESLDDYIKIHLCDDQKPVMTLMTMKKVVSLLPDDCFARIHRSYTVALAQIASISARKLLLKNGETLPVTETYFEALNKKLHIP
ncbi:MAG: LytR/AlgR family response regulator transcription factor [Niabella sp.]